MFDTFEILASIPETVRQQIQKGRSAGSDEALSIAIHSRHTVAEDDGSHVNLEQACLHQMLNETVGMIDTTSSQPERRRPCQVFIMSDRTSTLTELQQWIQETYGCAVWTHQDLEQPDALHNDESSSKTISGNGVDEHGPFAGGGFLQDLELASLARHGLIGETRHGKKGGRSSTALLQELMAYDRVMEQYGEHGVAPKSALPDLMVCRLPERYRGKGYSYDGRTYFGSFSEERAQKLLAEGKTLIRAASS